MTSVAITPSVFYFGTPVVLLSTSMPDGSTNLTPISSAWALGDVYVLGLGADHQGTTNLRRTGEVVLNLPDASLAASVERIAPTTGAAAVPASKQPLYRHERDKWSLGGFTAVPSETVAPDRIAECPVQIEARLVEVTPLADSSACAVQVRVERTHIAESMLVPGTSYVDTDSWRPLYYTFRHYFAQGERVGRSFRAEV